MKSLVRPELPTAALRSSQATHAAVDNSAPLATRPESTYKSGKVVQTNGATSQPGRTHTSFTVGINRLSLIVARAISRNSRAPVQNCRKAGSTSTSPYLN